MAKEDKHQQVAEAPKRDVSIVDYGEDAGAGFQNQNKDDYALPFIDILQPGSPEVVNAGRDGARAGDIINRVTGEVWNGEKGIPFIPAITEHCYTEWKPRKGANGETLPGGFVGRHELTEEIVQKARAENPFKAYRMQNGNDLVETFYVFGLHVSEDGGGAPVGFAFGSTKIKAYKNFNYIARAIQVLTPQKTRVNPPLFSHRYRYTSKSRTEAGNTWFIPVLGFDGPDAESCRYIPTDALYVAARGVMVAYTSGALKADYSKTSADVGSGGDPDGKPPF